MFVDEIIKVHGLNEGGHLINRFFAELFQNIVYLRFDSGHFHMAQGTDLPAALSVKQEAQEFQLCLSEGRDNVYRKQKACLIGFYPFEFSQDLGGQLRTKRAVVMISVPDACQYLFLRGIFQEIITYAELEGGKDQFIFFIYGENDDFGIEAGMIDLFHSAQARIFFFHLNVHQDHVRMIFQSFLNRHLSGSHIRNDFHIVGGRDDFGVKPANRFHIFCDQHAYHLVFHRYSLQFI